MRIFDNFLPDGLSDVNAICVSVKLSLPPNNLRYSELILELIWAIKAGRESGAPDALAFW